MIGWPRKKTFLCEIIIPVQCGENTFSRGKTSKYFCHSAGHFRKDGCFEAKILNYLIRLIKEFVSEIVNDLVQCELAEH